MNPNADVIDELRDRIERKHHEALAALELLSRYFDESPSNTGESGFPMQVSQRGIQPGSQRALIAQALDSFKSVSQIAKETGLTEAAVRGCLYAKDFKRKVDKKRMNKKLRFKMRMIG